MRSAFFSDVRVKKKKNNKKTCDSTQLIKRVFFNSRD